MKQLKVGLIFGGKSVEHEGSLISARLIYNALNKKKYDIKLIGIDKSGIWRLGNSLAGGPKNFWVNPENLERIKLNLKTPKITAVSKNGKAHLIDLKNGKNITDIDVFFPITHGTFGEDGCLQGFLELLDTAYVGSGVLGSSVGMDKDIMKRLFREAGILTCKFYALERLDSNKKYVDKIIKDLKFPIFVKPANLGSSVGISKASNRKELNKAVKDAFLYDNKIVLEECVNGREIECSILGNVYPPASGLIASVPGEIKLKHGFYSYNAKYINEDAAVPVPKADLTRKEIKKIRNTAVKIFKILGCEGMGRMDFFLTKDGKLYANEINTLPGFTNISMYPKMFEESGIPYPKLLDKLIQLGIERKRRNDKLIRNYK